MTELSPNVRSDFFGKDRFVAFLGMIEDVNDPKHAGRVKVRCVGWHPKDKKELKTEDLPWAKVGAPTTHAQANRIGGKHGLLVGSLVFGCFLDGDEAQVPLVLSSLPLTAASVDKSNKTIGTGEPTASEDSKAFAPTIENKNHPNVGVVTTKEQGSKNFSDKTDPAGTQAPDDSDSDCHGPKARQSAGSARCEAEMKKSDGAGNAEGQKYEVVKADGLCGSIKHAQEDIQRNMKEMIPSQLSRFVYNDVVWNTFTGNYMDVNGILQQLAQLICNLLKQPANAKKAESNAADRVLEGVALAAAIDRDGPTRVKAEQQQKKKGDQKNAIFQETLIDVLCEIIMQLLQAMDNSGGGNSNNDNSGGDGGSVGDTNISNSEAKCLSVQLLDNVNIIIDQQLELAEQLSQEYVDNDESDSGDSNEIASILGSLLGAMLFPLIQKYSEQTEVHNTAGSRSQDIRTKIQGCNPERLYNTAMGFMGGGGINGGDVTGGAHSNASDYENVGFGGGSVPAPTEINNIPCEEATTPVVPDPGFDNDGNPIPVPPVTIPGSGVVIPDTKPDGNGGSVIPLPLPSDNEICAKNFINGVPNTIVVIRGGRKYYYNNPSNPEKGFPTIYIPGYQGVPVPVVDKITGELVSIITSCSLWPTTPQPPVTIIPDNGEIGITTDDEDYDFVLGGFHIANVGNNYCDPYIEIWDRDKETTDNGEARAVVVEGRIVAVDLINNGTGFRRVPEIRIYDDGKACGTDGGFGARIYPIINVIPKLKAKKTQIPIEVVYCPAPRQKNLF